MRKFKVTLLTPHERIIEAVDLVAANKEALRLSHIGNTNEDAPKAILHSVVEQFEDEAADFGPSPAA